VCRAIHGETHKGLKAVLTESVFLVGPIVNLHNG